MKRRRWSPDENAAMLIMAGAGRTDHDIGATFGRTWESVRKHRLALVNPIRRKRELEAVKKPEAEPRSIPRPPRTQWFGRCPAFHPRTDDDANRATRL